MEVDCTQETKEYSETSSEKRSNFRDDILSHLSDCADICVKSQQIGEPELSKDEKQVILRDILDRSHSMFLSRFGQHLLPEHFTYFDNPSDEESYEVRFYLNRFRKRKPRSSSDVQVRNRRFEAMKRLMAEGEYFSVSEMRKRNPLLFDQLLGNFLKNPKIEYNNDQKYQVAHILLDQLEQDQVAVLKQAQLEAEMKQAQECLSSDDETKPEFEETSMVSSNNSSDEDEVDLTLWGNTYKNNPVIGKKRWKDKYGICRPKPVSRKKTHLSQEEKLLLINEFTSSMFNHFLEGKDDEFDYSQVDNNPEYDDIRQCEIDEQEKYFDSESPEDAVDFDAQNDEDDELDQFMKEVHHEVESENLADQLKNMNSKEVV